MNPSAFFDTLTVSVPDMIQTRIIYGIQKETLPVSGQSYPTP